MEALKRTQNYMKSHKLQKSGEKKNQNKQNTNDEKSD